MDWFNVLAHPGDLWEALLHDKLVGGGGSSVLQTVTGVSPLTLLNVARKGIKSLTQFGKCEQASTPTPSVPVDIKCNNGALKCRMESGLPVGYRRLEYIQSTGTQYINTGFAIPDLTNEYEVEYKITVSGGTGQGASSNNWGYMGQNGGLMLTLTGNHGVGAGSEGVPWVADHIYEISHHRGSDASRSVTVDGTVFQFGNQATAYADREFGIFSLSPFTTNFNRIYGKLYDFKAYKNGELVVSLIPCKRMSDNAIGVYDIVNDTFIGNAGTDAFIAGADNDETHIGVVGTPEVLTVCGKNIYNKNYTASEINAFINSTNNKLTQGTTQYAYVLPCKPNTTYTASGMGERTSRWGSFTSKEIGTVATAYASGNGTITTGANDKYIIGLISAQSQSGDIDFHDTLQIEVGSTATDYEPYTGQTASVENLLGVGDYKDEQNIISGEVERKVGVKILDGTEEWTTDTYGGSRRFVTRNFAKEQLSIVVCTHYSSTIEDGSRTSPNNAYVAASGALSIYRASTQSIDTVADWKAYLAQQYANGTPVVIVYPLAETTTEQVTAQHLTARDTATITAQTDNISDVTLEVQYWEKAE